MKMRKIHPHIFAYFFNALLRINSKLIATVEIGAKVTVSVRINKQTRPC